MKRVFISWILENYKGSRPIFLGGANKDDTTSCILVSNGIARQQKLLKCNHEEANDRMLFHRNHAIKVGNFKKIVIASPDTDVLVNAIHHFSRWVYLDLKELWITGGKKGAQKQAVPIHTLVEELDEDMVEILPALHALTGISQLLHLVRIFNTS